MRASHRSEIKRAERLLDGSKIYFGSVPRAIFTDFQQLHFEAAGRVTRSSSSWDEMFSAIEAGDAILSTVNYEGRLVGCSFIWVSKTSALYGTGAYRRELFSEIPVSHLPLFNSIIFAKGLGCSMFYLGQAYVPEGSGKEQKISFFKRGFTDKMQAYQLLSIGETT
jgi:hypothetical protein